MIDGLRWQEVFRGMDEGLLTEQNHAKDPGPVITEFGAGTAEERRRTLMPFLWGKIAKEGQIYGNQDRGSIARITNPFGVSYPGYSETITGVAEPSIQNNRKIPNPNVTVYEWLNAKPAFAGRVAAFGAWDVFPFIFNVPRSKLPVDDGTGALAFGTITPAIETVNRVRRETVYRWGNSAFDSFVFIPMLEWVKVNKPRLVFLCLGETDEWAHESDYPRYLRAARKSDGYVQEIWETLQAMPEYRCTTTLVVHPDHGRGDTRGEGENAGNDWPNHGVKHPGSENIWFAVIGPDTPPLGERAGGPEIRMNQFAATIAAFLGEDFPAAFPASGAKIADVFATD